MRIWEMSVDGYVLDAGTAPGKLEGFTQVRFCRSRNVVVVERSAPISYNCTIQATVFCHGCFPVLTHRRPNRQLFATSIHMCVGYVCLVCATLRLLIYSVILNFTEDMAVRYFIE